MTFVERVVLFECAGDELIGVLAAPDKPLATGVVVVVGGPQYRAGSHRQFVYLARALADAGIACLRFDYRGMGDSEGAQRSFDTVDADIAAAVKAFKNEAPNVQRVVLWGLCDGASASLIAARTVPGLAGIVALNPWVRDATSLDRAIVKHYYARRFFSWGFWRKLLSGGLDVRATAFEFGQRLKTAFGRSEGASASNTNAVTAPARYQDRMCDGLAALHGSTLIVLSGNDLTAQEYVAFAEADQRWKRVLQSNGRVVTRHLPQADHTFSNETWRIEVERMSCDFARAVAGNESEQRANAAP